MTDLTFTADEQPKMSAFNERFSILNELYRYWWYRQAAGSDVDYVYSADRNAYPDNGTSGDYTYQYLGIPFENAREASKVVVGQYTGTGRYGLASANQLVFNGTPKVVMIPYYRTSNTYQAYQSLSLQNYIWILNIKELSTEYASFKGFGGQGNNLAYTPQGKKSTDGRIISWYNGTAELQFNSTGHVYTYIALF